MAEQRWDDDPDELPQSQQAIQEVINWNGIQIPVRRAGMPDLFIALQPPEAQPYVMAPRELDPKIIIDFFIAHSAQIEELRADMLKRYKKSPTRKCRYQTGDVAYALGRPFQLRVYPLAEKRMKVKKGARGTVTYKFSMNPEISLITLYVPHPGNYDEGKKGFNGYAEPLILRNAEGLVRDFSELLMPGQNPPVVRMRSMRGRWSSDEAGALWLSTDLIPYPPDCLVYVIWRELEKKSTLLEEEMEGLLEHVLPGWKQAQRILQERPEPYCLQ